MRVATCVVTIQLYGVGSLKGKRRIIKSIMSRLPRHFNVAIAEVDCHDTWQTSVIAFVTVGNDSGYLHGLLEKAIAWIDSNCLDVTIEDYSIEIL